jgi:hypothetical protein
MCGDQRGSRRCCFSIAAASHRRCSATTVAGSPAATTAMPGSPCTCASAACAATTAARAALPAACPDCGSRLLLTHGLGTEQTEEFLARAQLPVHRIDSDALHARAARRCRPCGDRPGGRALRDARHADADQGPPLSRRAAGLHHRRRRAAVQRRFSRRGAHGAADRAGRRPCRTGAQPAVGCCCRHTTPITPCSPPCRHGYAAVARHDAAQRRAAGLPPFGQLCLLRCDCREERDGERSSARCGGPSKARCPVTAPDRAAAVGDAAPRRSLPLAAVVRSARRAARRRRPRRSWSGRGRSTAAAWRTELVYRRRCPGRDVVGAAGPHSWPTPGETG